MSHAGWLRGEIGSYLSTHRISARKMGAISGVPYKTILRFCRDICGTRYTTFSNLLNFLELEAESGRHKFFSPCNGPTPLNYQNKLDALRKKLLDIMQNERITPTGVFKETGVAGETISTFCRNKREITFITFGKLTDYVESKDEH